MNFNFPLYLRLMHASFFRSRKTPGRLCPQRLVFLLVQSLVLYPLLEILHRLAWGLDRLLYPAYRKQEVEAPVFIIAPHRSGTTLLLDTLARDPQFRPAALWEILFAPAIVERKAIWAIGALDRRLGSPLTRGLRAFKRSWNALPQNRPLLSLHPLHFTRPEEDIQFLLHLSTTYDLLAFLPFPDLLRDYADYSRRVPAHRRRREMAFYRDMVKRHLYAHKGGRPLSKSPTFSPAIPDVLETFPDARFIHLVRAPVKVVPSSFSLWRGHWIMNGCPRDEDLAEAARSILEHNRIWYRRLYEDLAHLPPERLVRVSYDELKADLRGTVEHIYRQLELTMPPALREYLAAETPKVRAYRSHHRYLWEVMQMTPETVAQAFADLPPVSESAIQPPPQPQR
ncbi:MAG TPA: sulfotransferase [Chloroflexi bacterium]|nr:sulfotransferase [Chloroflexota bacterium]